MEKLQLKHLAPYLPYDLNYYNVNLKHVNPIGLSNLWLFLKEDNDHLKPILRPLSNLTKEIEINGEIITPINEINKFAPLGEWFGFAIELDSLKEIGLRTPESWLNPIYMIEFLNKLYEWHFDVFGLIEKDLAIDINTL